MKLAGCSTTPASRRMRTWPSPSVVRTEAEGAALREFSFTPGEVFQHANLAFVSATASVDLAGAVVTLTPTEGEAVVLPDVGADMHAWKGCSDGCVACFPDEAQCLVHVPSSVTGYTLRITQE